MERPASARETVVGRAVRVRSNLVTVETDGRLIECTVRGRLRLEERTEANPVVAGDKVRIAFGADGTGAVEEVLPRDTVLERTREGKLPQVLAANVETALLVFAAALPDPDAYQLYQLDKMLVQSQAGGLAPLICCNKIDLRPENRAVFLPYECLGFPLLFTSAVTGEGIDDLRAALRGKLSVVAGPSGVGKSSLLNALCPGLNLRTAEVSDWTRKGRHTTTASEMHAIGSDTWIVDTPGIRRLNLREVPAEEVDYYFPEMRGLWESCRAFECNHVDEAGCEVKRRVEEGTIDNRRYESYKSIVEGR